MAYTPFDTLSEVAASLRNVESCYAVPLLAIPQPYDFEVSTERFRAFGPDVANLWHEGGLHRVVGGREVRIAAAPGGVLVEPLDAEIEAEVVACSSACRSTSSLLPRGERPDRRRPDLEARGLPAAARAQPVREPRHLDHGAAGLALRGVRDPQPDDRALRRRAASSVRVPAREAVAAADEESSTRSASRAGRPSTSSGSHGPTSTSTRCRAPRREVKARLTAIRGLGEWTADWFLARHLARPRAWAPGDLGVRKAVAFLLR